MQEHEPIHLYKQMNLILMSAICKIS